MAIVITKDIKYAISLTENRQFKAGQIIDECEPFVNRLIEIGFAEPVREEKGFAGTIDNKMVSSSPENKSLKGKQAK